MNTEEIQGYIDKGFLQVRIIIELLGKPKEHVQEIMHRYVNKIAETPHIKIISKTVAEPKEQEIPDPQHPEKKEIMYSTFCELEFMIKGISKLIGLCFDYMPASIEILEPQKIAFTNHTTTDFVNDLQTKLHKMDAILKQRNSEISFLRKNMHMTVLNLIAISLHRKKLTKAELAQSTGIPEEGLEAFLKVLKDQNRIKEEDSKYSLI